VNKIVYIRGMKEIDFYSTTEWRNLRLFVLASYPNRCMKCKSEKNLQIDHIKPRYNYPDLELVFDNLQILCKSCNKNKSNKHCKDYRPYALGLTPAITKIPIEKKIVHNLIVRELLKNKPKISKEYNFSNKETIKFTRDILRKGTNNNSMTTKQKVLLGVFTNEKGWINKILGKYYPKEIIEKFLLLKKSIK
jgi:hypothetical protein